MAVLVILGCVLFVAILPARFDPAIRLKEWLVSKENRHDR
jgi:hypothetical protein